MKKKIVIERGMTFVYCVALCLFPFNNFNFNFQDPDIRKVRGLFVHKKVYSLYLIPLDFVYLYSLYECHLLLPFQAALSYQQNPVTSGVLCVINNHPLKTRLITL